MTIFNPLKVLKILVVPSLLLLHVSKFKYNIVQHNITVRPKCHSFDLTFDISSTSIMFQVECFGKLHLDRL